MVCDIRDTEELSGDMLDAYERIVHAMMRSALTETVCVVRMLRYACCKLSQ